MQKKISTWKFILKSLEENIPVILLYVLESKGSSPGRQGFFMAVNAKHEMKGSIGGGIMEYKFAETAKARLAEENPTNSIHKQIHDKAVTRDQSGMICSGEQTIFLYQVKKVETQVIKNIIYTLESDLNGQLSLSEAGISFNSETVANKGLFFIDEKNWSYGEMLGLKDHLYVVGGGHCALALCGLMQTLEFYIHLFDERKGLNTIENNHFTHEKKYLGSYEELKSLVPAGNNIYVVIMTFGYRTDDIALRALRDKDFKYIGCLGSSKKMDKMITAYKAEGIDSSWLDKVHAPIGLQIKSQTPEEIAVSIAAEIIKLRNQEK